MAKWMSTTGKITRSEVDSEGDKMDRPIIHWAYRVNGRRYEGQMPEMGYSSAEEIVAAYPVGKLVEVRYNPAKPEESVVKGLEGLIRVGRNTGVIAVVMLIAIFGLFAAIFIAINSPTTNWVSTTGEITRSEVGVYVDSEGGNMDQPIIHWAYYVNDRRYEGQMHEMGFLFAQQVVAAYPVGKWVEVRYDPSKPERSVVKGLEWLVDFGQIVTIIFIAVFGLFGAIFIASITAPSGR